MITASIVVLYFIVGCATVEGPSGGPADTVPPELIASYPDSASTNIPVDSK